MRFSTAPHWSARPNDRNATPIHPVNNSRFSANFAREKLIPWGWEGDGILAWLGAGDDLAEFVKAARKPTVDFSFRRPYLQFPRVR